MYPAKYVVMWSTKEGLWHERYFAFPWSQMRFCKRIALSKPLELWTAELKEEYVWKRFCDRFVNR